MINNHKVIAFIPVRVGLNSIPLKNIKTLCGKPLVCWNIEALEACPEVDEVIVATDPMRFGRLLNHRIIRKRILYRRSALNASDTPVQRV
jgi:N-acylneuraminate cytidylyltransferase